MTYARILQGLLKRCYLCRENYGPKFSVHRDILYQTLDVIHVCESCSAKKNVVQFRDQWIYIDKTTNSVFLPVQSSLGVYFDSFLGRGGDCLKIKYFSGPEVHVHLNCDFSFNEYSQKALAFNASSYISQK